MTANRIRVRYAPSPTGYQHIGGIRTALFNYLYARSKGGDFVLRVEDTDRRRSKSVYEEDLYRQLSWLGLLWDEGPLQGGPYAPYRQSEREDRYRAAVKELLDSEQAYYCYCTPDELQAERERALAEGRPPRYSGRCRSPEVRQALAREGRPPAVRFRVPEGKTVRFHDLVRGDISFESDDIGDFVIYRASDESLARGRALYNMAAVVDDAAMGISTVLRGEEHLSNTPRQIMLYEALGHEPPHFGHLSLIVSVDGSKLSKRAGDTSISHYKEEGYLPEALVAYVATLGWAPGRHAERLDLDDLISLFDVRRLSSNPATFDPQRLLWFNQRRLQSIAIDELAPLTRPRLEAAYGTWHRAQDTACAPQEWFELLLEAAQEEAQTLNELVALCDFALEDSVNFDDAAKGALAQKAASTVLKRLKDRVRSSALDDAEVAHDLLQGLRNSFDELSGREVLLPIRAALTGRVRGPSLSVVMALLGPKRCLQRLERVC